LAPPRFSQAGIGLPGAALSAIAGAKRNYFRPDELF